MSNPSVVLFDRTKNEVKDGIERQRIRRRIHDAAQDEVRDLERNKRKFDDLVNNSEKILFKAKSVFPFTLFPDQITIDPVKVNVISSEFFSAERVHCIYIKNILDVFLDAGPFLATLRIVDQSFTENTVIVSFLKKSEAYRARRIIQGLIVAHQQEIDVTGIADEKLTDKLERLGNA